MVLANPSDNVVQRHNVNVFLEWNQDATVTIMEVYLAIDMEVVFNQMKNDLLSKWFRVAIDCDRSQVDAK